MFAFSSNKHPLPLEKFKANLVILMQPSHSNEASMIELLLTNPSDLVDRKFTHLWTEGGEESWWEGKMVGGEDGGSGRWWEAKLYK